VFVASAKFSTQVMLMETGVHETRNVMPWCIRYLDEMELKLDHPLYMRVVEALQNKEMQKALFAMFDERTHAWIYTRYYQ
jgi:hypothetical protein